MKQFYLIFIVLLSLNTAFAHEGINLSISANDFTCKVNDDCVTVNLSCTGSCGASANKRSLKKFQNARKYLCTDYHGPWKMMSCPVLDNKCISGVCMRISIEQVKRMKPSIKESSNEKN